MITVTISAIIIYSFEGHAGWHEPTGEFWGLPVTVIRIKEFVIQGNYQV